MAKKLVRSFTKMADDLLENPKTKVTAKDLRIAPVHLVGHLYALWSGTKKFAEDGDLSRFDDDMISFLAEYGGDSAKFVQALQHRGWLDGKLIHDWIDHQREWLISKYKNRPHILEAVWARHGRKYGRDDPDGEDAAAGGGDPLDAGKLSGSNREVNGKSSGSDWEPQEAEVEKELKALCPQALSQEETKSPKGGLGENGGACGGVAEPQGSLNSFSKGFRVQGSPGLAETMPCAGFTVEEVFDALEKPLRFHGILSPHELGARVKHCQVDPAYWAMLFLDKLDAGYRIRDGTCLVESEDADPIAMTIGGLRPKSGGQKHAPTDAARGFFAEIMQERAKAKVGLHARWNGNLTGPAVAVELGRRKGKGRKR